MSDRLFYGNFFLDETKVALSIIVIYLLISLFPSMFQVSSLLLLKFDDVFDKNQWWRPFTALFAVNHPDTLLLILFLLYISRSYEFYHGSVAYGFQFLLSIVFAALPFIALGFFDYFKGRYIIEYALTVPSSMAISTIISQFSVNNWKGRINGKLNFLQGFGYTLVLFLAAGHRFLPESAIATLWGTFTGALLTLITKNTCGRCKKAK